LVILNGNEPAVYTFSRRDGQLIIPSTSIKGAVRSVFEALSNSCVSQVARKDKRPPKGHHSCREVKKGQEDRTHLCPACRLFGTTGYRGRVHFSDAVPVGQIEATRIKIADLWPPRQAKGRKFYQSKAFHLPDMRPEKNHRFLEVVPQEAKFQTTLFFENLSASEVGVLLRALGLGPHPRKQDSIVYAFPIKMGGAKPRCLGSVRFRPAGLFLVDRDDLLNTLPQGRLVRPMSPQLRRWLDNTGLVDESIWECFREKARPKPDTCPQEVY
jgi:CRISPR/Cas system CSM-associated protein Csm3 (group 7 of RAMP superfamily)